MWTDTGTTEQLTNGFPIERAGYLIDQVAEEFPGGKLSCALTTQLNAHILFGNLDTLTALEIQDELCTNPTYDRYWTDRTDSLLNPLGRAWRMGPHGIGRLLCDDFGVETNLSVSPIMPYGRIRITNTTGSSFGFYTGSKLWEATQQVADSIRLGSAAYIAGDSIYARHARLAFRVAEFPDKFYLHDPNHMSTTSVYSYEQLQEFYRYGAWLFTHSPELTSK